MGADELIVFYQLVWKC